MKSKLIKLFTKILILLLTIITTTYIFVACSRVKTGTSYTLDMIQYSEFVSENERYRVYFRDDDGTFVDYSEYDNVVIFTYEYSVGICNCSYYELNEENEAILKEINFVFINENMLYSSTINSYLIRSVD